MCTTSDTNAGRRWIARGLAMWLMLGSAGCSLDGLLNSDKVPTNLSDPAVTETPAGAQAAYIGTLAQFRHAFGSNDIGSGRLFVAAAGILSDELHALESSPLDNRNLALASSQGGDEPYASLQKVRSRGRQAIGLLTDYLPATPALRGHLYALTGYAEVFLAELYCSGIPLSTLDYRGDFTYRPGSTTDDVFAHAVALFDTAQALAGDSARILDLARLGQARALLDRGEYAAAASAVAPVADGYRYAVGYSATGGNSGTNSWWNFLRINPVTGGGRWTYTVVDHEGFNGLAWRTSGDPRTPIVMRGTAISGSTVTGPLYYPSHYDSLGGSPLVLASGVEARLIGAEAQLQAAGLGAGGAWLPTLNALRTDGTFDVDTQVVSVDNTVSPPDTTFAYDTLWHAGSGGVDSLAPLTDPGTADGRVDLLFRERAFWLFLTGHRQGDLRRLIRQYGRTQDQVYPIGAYYLGTNYGSDVTVPVPASEFINPLYTGCASRQA